MTELSGKRIVMTGATGFIGSHVAKRFLEAGAEVYCLVRPESQKTACTGSPSATKPGCFMWRTVLGH